MDRESDPREVSIERVDERSAGLLANLLELYLHDLSEIFPLEVGADGRFGYDALPRYWAEPEARFAFLVRAGGRIAGFALAMRGSPASDDPEVLDVAEFFVLRGQRRSGLGRRAAHALWDRLPGRWLVRVAEANRAGLPFWEEAVRGYTGGAFETREHVGSQRFRVFSFTSGG